MALPVHKEQDIVLHSTHDQLPFGLDAFYQHDGRQKPVIVFIHGFNGFKDWGHFNLIAEYAAQNGFAFVKFNLSHNGTTLMRPTQFVNLQAYGTDHFSTDLDDIGVVINYLHSDACGFRNEMDLDSIFLVGHSRAGALTILKAGEDERVKGIATWASIISTMHFWIPENVEKVERDGVVYVTNGRTGQSLPLYKSYYEDVLLNDERLNVKEKLKSLTIPILISHGDADPSVPVDFVHKLQEWKPEAEKFMVEGASHTFGGYHPYDQATLPEHAQLLLDKTLDFFGQIQG